MPPATLHACEFAPAACELLEEDEGAPAPPGPPAPPPGGFPLDAFGLLILLKRMRMFFRMLLVIVMNVDEAK